MNPFSTFSMNTLLPLAVMLPFIAAGMTPVLRRWPNLREAWTLMCGVALFLLMLSMHQRLITDQAEATMLLWRLDSALTLSLHLEPLGLFFLLVISALWPLTVLYSIGYMRANAELHQTRFHTCLSLAIGFAVGLALANDLFTAFICYEMLTLVTLPLVIHSGSEEAKRAGRLYITTLLGASLLLFLPALLWLWNEAGTLTFEQGGILRNLSGLPLGLLLILCVYGIAKAAMMPLHRWLPAAMVAPAPVSALLHAVAVVKAGAFLILKMLVYIFGPYYLSDAIKADWWAGGWLTWLAGLSALAAGIGALKQQQLKKRLAYSTVAQLAYITLSAAVLAPVSLLGAALHLVAHAFAKITLFFAAGAIYTASAGKKTHISHLDGIGRTMPITMAAFAVASISLIGLPPTYGFISKWFILQEAWLMAHYEVVVVLMLSTLLNAAYLLPILYRAYFNPLPTFMPQHGEAPRSMCAAMAVTAVACLGLFFFLNFTLTIGVRLVNVIVGGSS